jgi:hypothetical protein
MINEQKIRYVTVMLPIEGDEGVGWLVGMNGVTHITATEKPGLHCNIPYIQIWKGECLAAEYCQHGIVGVEFFMDTPQ